MRKGSRMTPEEIAELQKSNEDMAAKLKLAEAGKGGDDESRKRLVYLEDEHKKLIDARDKLKEDKRVADELKLTEQGEFKILADNKQLELDDLNKKLEGLTGTIDSYTARDELELEELKALVPEALRGTLDSENIPLAEKLTLAKQLATEKLEGPGARLPGKVKVQTLQEEYDQAVKDGDISKQMSLKRQLHKKG